MNLFNEKKIELTPAERDSSQLKREAVIFYSLIGAALAFGIYSDVGGFYTNLKTAFPASIAMSISLTLVLGFDLAITATFICIRNVFAVKLMNFSSWALYVVLTAIFGWGAFHFGGIIVDNVHALGAKRRAFDNPVKYENDPLLAQGRQRLATINAAIEESENSMVRLAATMKQAGESAGAFTRRAGDTLLTASARRDQLWNATKANRTQGNLGQSLIETQKTKQHLLVEKLKAQGWIDSVLVELDGKYRGKSEEDIVEASIGRNLLVAISSATVISHILAIAFFFMIGAYLTGVVLFRPVAYRSTVSLPTPVNGGVGTPIDASRSAAPPILTPPEPIKRPFEDMDAMAACDWLEFLLLTGQYIDKEHPQYDMKRGGSFSETLHRVGGRDHANQGHLSRRVKKVKTFMLTANDGQKQYRISELVDRHNWQEYCETPPVTPLREGVAGTNGKLQHDEANI